MRKPRNILAAGTKVVLIQEPCSDCPPYARAWLKKGQRLEIVKFQDTGMSAYKVKWEINGRVEQCDICPRHIAKDEM